MRFHRWLFGFAFALSLWMTSTYAQAPDSLRVPAFTAFIEPQPNGLRVSQKTGITGWTDPSNQIAWYGELKATGQLQVAVSVRLPKNASVQYALAVAGQTLQAGGKGDGVADSVAVNFDPVVIPSPGYYRIALAGLKKDGETFGNVEALLLTGSAVKDAHFSLVERRNAASVHLGYPLPRDSQVEWFYNEVTVRTEPLWSYYMACGFHRGYFGIQVSGRFYLSNGGFVAEPVPYGDTIQRPGGGQPPTEIVLPNEAPLFRFGLFADVQYADKEAQGPRHYRESAAKLKACVDDFNQRDLAFVVNLGDLIDGHGAQSEPELKQMLDLVKPLHAPLHHVIGNHCLEVERPALMSALNLSLPYYDFQRPGWRFIVLDGMEVSQRSVKGSAEAEAAQEFLKNNPQLSAYNGALGQRQLTWLKQQLTAAKQSQQKVIVFCHHPIEVTASDASHVLWNHVEVAKLLANYGCVVAWFNGHDHRGGYAARNGIHHVTLPGMVEAPAGRNRCAVVEVYADRLIIQGIGDVPQRNLNLHPVEK